MVYGSACRCVCGPGTLSYGMPFPNGGCLIHPWSYFFATNEPPDAAEEAKSNALSRLRISSELLFLVPMGILWIIDDNDDDDDDDDDDDGMEPNGIPSVDGFGHPFIHGAEIFCSLHMRKSARSSFSTSSSSLWGTR